MVLFAATHDGVQEEGWKPMFIYPLEEKNLANQHLVSVCAKGKTLVGVYRQDFRVAVA